MKVKIGTNIYDSNEEPIMLILDEKDKNNIKDMHPFATKFCSYPDFMNEEEVKKFMRDE